MFTIGGYFVYKFFQSPLGKNTPVSGAKTSSGSTGMQPGLAATQTGDPSPRNQDEPEYSSEWRHSGSFTANGSTWAVLVDLQGRPRFESPSVFTGSGITAFGIVDNTRVTSFTGVRTGSSILPTQQPSPPPAAKP
jgi:hypothetical protein